MADYTVTLILRYSPRPIENSLAQCLMKYWSELRWRLNPFVVIYVFYSLAARSHTLTMGEDRRRGLVEVQKTLICLVRSYGD